MTSTTENRTAVLLGPHPLFLDALHQLGREQEWDARITVDEPEQRLVWVTQDGPSDVMISFAEGDSARTLVTVVDVVHERGFASQLALLSGFARWRMSKELDRFKAVVEGEHRSRTN